MINVKELKIGNFLYSETGEMLPIAYIKENIIGLNNSYGGVQKHQKEPIFSYDIDKLEFVELTQDLIIDFGFEERVKTQHRTKFEHSKSIDFEVWVQDNKFFIVYKGDVLIMINYLHQLQNIFYCLFSYELEAVK